MAVSCFEQPAAAKPPKDIPSPPHTQRPGSTQRTRPQAELRRQEQIEHNRGVYIAATLAAAPLPSGAAAARGVRRGADKISLPRHLSNELMKQSAHEQGLPFWRLSARDGRATVASALDFDAPEGTVLLPPKVAQSLWGLEVRSTPAPGSFCANCVPQGYPEIPFCSASN